MKKTLILLFGLLSFALGFSQATSSPAMPTENEPLVITFDIDKCSSQRGTLKGTTEPIYAHMGVITTKSATGTEWMSRIALWPERASAAGQNCNIDEVRLIPVAGQPDIYTLTMPNGVRNFFLTHSQESPIYQFDEDEHIIQIEIVLRNADGSRDGRMEGSSSRNVVVPIYTESLHLRFEAPTENIFITKNQIVNFSALASQTCDLTLAVEATTIATATAATEINASHQFVNSGAHTVSVTGTNASGTSTLSLVVTVRGDIVSQPRPAGLPQGINYIDDHTVTLILYAPRKELIYAVGDFNDWVLDNDYMMKKDGDYWWITLSGLEKGREYAFYYNVDGLFNVGDPYTNKVLDRGNDSSIPASVYPNLRAFPAKATGSNMVSVFQTGQVPFEWQVTDFKAPRQDQLVIYELLFRDFTQVGNGNGDVKSAMEKLDYLQSLGINAIELMPFNEFDGNNSWGYNPAFYFAPDKAYGTADDYKRFIDECHKRGIAVIQDMVLNHSYGQSPFCRLYAATPGSTNARPAPDNPWYNVSAPHTCYSWGADFNHESEQTQALVDSICAFWMKEYKIDGFRFDFTKGFTNATTGNCGSDYDASRIRILKRMYDEIKKRNKDAYVILEHFSEEREERELGDYGMLMWTRANDQFYQSGMAVSENSGFSGILAKRAGWNYDNKVGYMESHDEERTAYRIRNFSNLATSRPTTLKRQMDQLALNAAFFLALPGPKMLYQFGELGYDYSISSRRGTTTLDNGHRTDPKEVRWDYYDVPERRELYDTYSKLLHFRNQYANSITNGTLRYNISSADWPVRRIEITDNDMSFLLIGNFHATNSQTINPGLSGTWYDFMTGELANTSMFSLPPGRFKMFTSKRVTFPANSVEQTRENQSVKIVYSSTDGTLHFNTNEISNVTIYDLFGRVVRKSVVKEDVVDVSMLGSGIYLTQYSMSTGSGGVQKVLIER